MAEIEKVSDTTAHSTQSEAASALSMDFVTAMQAAGAESLKPSTGSHTYKMGDGIGKGGPDPEVSYIQTELQKLKYLDSSIDGKYGAGTKKAVSEFQKQNGLPVTGEADPATQKELEDPKAKVNSAPRKHSNDGGANWWDNIPCPSVYCEVDDGRGVL